MKRQTATAGLELWRQGTRGHKGPHATEQARMHNVRVGQNDVLYPRPGWVLAEAAYTHAYTPGEHRLINGSRIWDFDRFISVGTSPGVGNYAGIWNADTFVETHRAPAETSYSGVLYPAVNDGFGYCPPSIISDDLVLWGAWLLEATEASPPGSLPDGFTGLDIVVTNIAEGLRAAMLSLYYPRAEYTVVHNGRAFISGGMTVSPGYRVDRGRVYYSDAFGYGTFSSSLQFFEVDGNVAGMISLGTNLFIWTDDGMWYVLQGQGEPSELSLAKLADGRVPALAPVEIDGRAVFQSSDLSTLVTLSPDGKMNDIELQHLALLDGVEGARPDGPAHFPVASSTMNAIAIPLDADDNWVTNYNGVWTTEEVQPAFVSGVYGASPNLARGWSNENYETLLVGENVYRRAIVPTTPPPDQPLFTSEVDVKGEITLPRIASPGVKVRVHKVIVNLRTYGTANYPPEFTLTIADGDNNVNTSTTGPSATPFSEASTSEEESHRIEVTVSPQAYTPFADISVSFQGVGIEDIVVIFDLNEEPLV